MKMKLWMGFLAMGFFFGIGEWVASEGDPLFASERHDSRRVGVKIKSMRKNAAPAISPTRRDYFPRALGRKS